MKILIVHNDYGKYSGEEAVVDKMVSMLREHGHEVVQFRMTSAGSRDSLGGQIKGFLCGVYSPEGVKGMRDILHREKPDVVNVHNLYPFISPAALKECRKAGVPVVMTVHNFRLICPTGLFMRNGGPCEVCLQKGHEWSCIRYNCEHSMLKSVGYTLRSVWARWTMAYRDNVDRFACITDFQRRKLIAAGFEAEKMVVIPNFMDRNYNKISPIGNYVAFCGRLSLEKGVNMIIEIARRHPEILFRLAGEVRDLELVKNIPDNCELTGYLSGDSLRDFYQEAKFFVMASRWYEGFPMSILESAQYGKPTIGPDHGGFSEIIGSGEDAIGRLFRPGDVDDMEAKIVELWNSPDTVSALGQKAFERLRDEYSSEIVYVKWESLLSQVVGGNKPNAEGTSVIC